MKPVIRSSTYKFSPGWLSLYRQDYEESFLVKLRAILPSLASDSGIDLNQLTTHTMRSNSNSNGNDSDVSAAQYMSIFDRYFDLVLDLVYCPVLRARAISR